MTAEDENMPAKMDDQKIVQLTSKDGDSFTLKTKEAKLSQFVETTIGCKDDDDEDEDVEILLSKVGSECLAMVVEFLKHHSLDPLEPIETPLRGNSLEGVVQQEWYQKFILVDQSMVFELVTAANFMEIQPLLDLACLRVSVDLMGKSAEEIRVMLKIPKMTSEEVRFIMCYALSENKMAHWASNGWGDQYWCGISLFSLLLGAKKDE